MGQHLPPSVYHRSTAATDEMTEAVGVDKQMDGKLSTILFAWGNSKAQAEKKVGGNAVEESSFAFTSVLHQLPNGFTMFPRCRSTASSDSFAVQHMTSLWPTEHG